MNDGDSHTKRITSLITLVDENFNKESYRLQLTLRRVLLGVVPNIIVVLIVIWLFFVVFQMASFFMSIAEPRDAVTIMISITALTIALVSFIVRVGSDLQTLFAEPPERERIDWHFKKLKDKVSANERLLVRALIIMKCRQPDVKLFDLYNADESMLTERQLLERLYR